jgi:hypothetical protein
MRYIVVFFWALLWSSFSAQAHNNGGEIFYQYMGNQSGYQNGDYLIYATVYMDTGAYDTAAPIPDFEIYQGFQFLQKVTPQHLSSDQPMPPQYILSDTNAFGWFPTPAYNRPGNRNWWAPDLGQGCAGQRPTIEARYVALVNLPLTPFQIIFKPGCCRFTDNIAQGDSLVLRAFNRNLYPHSSLRNTSPANLRLCIDTNGSSLIRLRNRVRNTESDSVAFELSRASRHRGDSVRPARVIYKPGFAGNAPLPSGIPQQINQRTGTFSFRPNDTGQFNMVLKMIEVKNDTFGLIFFQAGNTFREIPIEIVRGCTPLGQPQHLFSSINPYTLEYETFALADSSQGDFADLYWNGQRVAQTLHRQTQSTATRLNYKAAIPLINLPYKFALGSSDWCGRNTAPATAHETIAVKVTENQGAFNAQWTAYQGQPVQQYRLYWADSSRQNFTLVDSVSAQTLQYNNFLLPAQAYYFMVEAVVDSVLVPAAWSFSGPVGLNGVPGRVVGLNEEEPRRGFRLFPNPAKEKLRVRLAKNTLAALPYQICNASGKVLIKGHLKPVETTLAIDDLPAGLYFFTVENKGTQRFVKQ